MGLYRKAGNDSDAVMEVKVDNKTKMHAFVCGVYKAIPLAVIEQLIRCEVSNMVFSPCCL